MAREGKWDRAEEGREKVQDEECGHGGHGFN